MAHFHLVVCSKSLKTLFISQRTLLHAFAHIENNGISVSRTDYCVGHVINASVSLKHVHIIMVKVQQGMIDTTYNFMVGNIGKGMVYHHIILIIAGY